MKLFIKLKKCIDFRLLFQGIRPEHHLQNTGKGLLTFTGANCHDTIATVMPYMLRNDWLEINYRIHMCRVLILRETY